MQKKYPVLFIAVAVWVMSACSFGENANSIIRKSIAFYGMDKLNGKTVEFDIKEKHFTVKFNKDGFFYESAFKDDSLGLIKDQLSNHGFTREQNGLTTPLSQKDSVKYAQSLNTVVYFTFLPLKLKDENVRAKFLRTVQVKGKAYNQIEVTFDTKDNQNDIFYFWFDAKDNSMDYFAYSREGNRFRAINGLVNSGSLYLQNYVILENKSTKKTALKDYYILFEQDKLSTLSHIDLENVSIK